VKQISGPPASVTTGSQVKGPNSLGSQATGPLVSESGTSESTTGPISSGDGFKQEESPR
jgi:hypothetical protein